VIRKILNLLRRKGFNIKNAVIVGATDLGMRLARHIENMPWAGITVKGFFDDQKHVGDMVMMDKPILGTIGQLSDYLRNNKVESVYIALPMRAEAQIVSLVNTTRTLGVGLYFVPDLFTFGSLNAEMLFLGNMLIYNFNPSFREKRYFDIVFSLLSLLVMFPVMLVIALWIKLQDGGPIFYRHRRITAAGKEFDCLKFRTMHVGADTKLAEILRGDSEAKAEWEKTFKLRNDPRVTRIGRFLRKTSLDELPQFINVLRGEMSVVGARPVVYAELHNYYKKNAGLYCSMKPGITGPWQVGKRSDTEDYNERVELDTWYVLNHSIWLDLKIILKTVAHIATGRGAY
jgi:exopolysaccharide biosynthesis polyprenyl glycosylphosphotransferase